MWSPYSDSLIDAYVLEIDDGAGGNFRVSFNNFFWQRSVAAARCNVIVFVLSVNGSFLSTLV